MRHARATQTPMLDPMWPWRRNPAHRIRSSDPFWLLRNGIGDARPALEQSLDCDVAIVGAGITGALIAAALIGTGRRIVVLDARGVAQGSSAATTALLQYEIDTHLTELTARLGAQRAARAYLACAASFELLERRFSQVLRHSNYQRRESLYLAKDRGAVAELRVECAARRTLGLECEWLDEAEVARRFGCRRPGGILSALGAGLDPVRFTRGIFAAAQRHGVRQFARSRVISIEERGGGLRLGVDGGLNVDAAHVVIAAGYESLDFLRHGVAEVDNTYALVTEPVPGRIRSRCMPLIWESARPYIYMRGTPDGRLLLGGADVPFREPAARDALLSRQVRRLAAAYRDVFGEDLPPIAYAWGGSFARTRDGLPYIGGAPDTPAGLHFALCYGGNGITYSAHAGDMIRARIDGHGHALDEVFGFARLAPQRRSRARQRESSQFVRP